ncbi:hypothetical protein HPB48_017663 [Haemaphysalis longicornis]|uniref:Uncharacterized protein n=1 Tax=Haemaphysalis longicornis TaxID=44386 RepID=A0A9J6GM63_HAELO|nr:hypothetical protein HPB48_017663 [Haemaphysalis longicornis]
MTYCTSGWHGARDSRLWEKFSIQNSWVKTTRTHNDDNFALSRDATPRAYGVAAYACIRHTEGNRRRRLLLPKVDAPLKAVTLAKLELMSATLAARMSKYIRDNTDLNIVETHLWSDSSITLCWICKETDTWNTYEKKRVY